MAFRANPISLREQSDFPGCFRCHDGSHSTADKSTTITQDCGTCHVPVAVDEAAPEVLKTLGLADRIANLHQRGDGTMTNLSSSPVRKT